MPGFRAHAESDPVGELVVTVDPRTFFVQPTTPIGNSLDIAREIAMHDPTPRTLRLQTNLELNERWQSEAVSKHFGLTEYEVHLYGHQTTKTSVWTQDFMKSGSAMQRNIVLIPRHSFEGDAANGPLLDPLLNTMEADDWVRSQLSWDGGDLMFEYDPMDPSKLIMFHGDAAKPYWAGDLTREEYAYILMREFGADEAVYAGEIASHVDYALNFLEDGETAVVAEPVLGNFDLSRQALELLIANHGPLPLLVELKRLHAMPDNMLAEQRDKVLQLIDDALASTAQWPRAIDVAVLRDAEKYASEHCPEDYQQCTSSEGLERLLLHEPELARRWITAATEAPAGEALPGALLGLVASQISSPDLERAERLLQLQIKLKDRGFRVVAAPVIGGGRNSAVRWAGISSTNFLVIGQKLFVPTFGLGKYELRLLQQLQDRLPRPYRVVPVFARAVLAKNGGVHCAVGTRRLGWESGVLPAVITRKQQWYSIPPTSLAVPAEE
ncbi:MAG: agmatine deiminase family protein [Bryobacterales bacterium]|nr:agmatine deiminase family protein [Bryobacterales bacterium]